MWNDITLTSQLGDVPRGDCKEEKKCQVLLITRQNIVSAFSRDERGRNDPSCDDVQREGVLGGDCCHVE